MSSPLRFYVYISDSKIQQYYDQMHASLLERLLPQNVAVGASGFRARLGWKSAPRTKYEKLDAIIDTLRASEQRIGTPSNPAKYIEGTLPMRWDTFSRDTLLNEQSMACFAYLARRNHVVRVVMLVGSAYHVIGKFRMAISETSNKEKTMEPWRVFSMDVTDITVAAREELYRRQREEAESGKFENVINDLPPSKLEEMIATLIETASGLRDPVQHMKFFAKTLCVKRVAHHFSDRPFPEVVEFVLATPFYVALEQ